MSTVHSEVAVLNTPPLSKLGAVESLSKTFKLTLPPFNILLPSKLIVCTVEEAVELALNLRLITSAASISIISPLKGIISLL